MVTSLAPFPIYELNESPQTLVAITLAQMLLPIAKLNGAALSQLLGNEHENDDKI